MISLIGFKIIDMGTLVIALIIGIYLIGGVLIVYQVNTKDNE